MLARHLRRCEKAKINKDLLPKGSAKRPRAKSACNQCAKSKLKCDSQNPCGHCKQSSLECKYTRQGYADPYMDFRVSRESGIPSPPENDATLDWISTDYPTSLSDESATLPNMQTNHAMHFNPLVHDLENRNTQQLYTNDIDLNSCDTNLYTSDDAIITDHNSANIRNKNVPTYFDYSNMFDFPLDAESLFLFPETMGYVDFDFTGGMLPLNPTSEASMLILLTFERVARKLTRQRRTNFASTPF